YTGMAAMEMELTLRYDPGLFFTSILVAVLLATLALWISYGLKQRLAIPHRSVHLIAALVMGSAIAGMHYTAMEAARFIDIPGAAGHAPGQQPNRYALAILIAAITVILSLII